jgi:hypothetical protein
MSWFRLARVCVVCVCVCVCVCSKEVRTSMTNNDATLSDDVWMLYSAMSLAGYRIEAHVDALFVRSSSSTLTTTTSSTTSGNADASFSSTFEQRVRPSFLAQVHLCFFLSSFFCRQRFLTFFSRI